MVSFVFSSVSLVALYVGLSTLPVQSQLSLPIEPWQHLSGFPATRPPSVYKGALPAGLRKRRTEGCLHTSITGQTPLQLLAPGWWAGEGGLSFLLLLGPEPSGPVMCPVRGCGCWNQAVFSEKPDSGSRGGQSPPLWPSRTVPLAGLEGTSALGLRGGEDEAFVLT